MTMMNAISSHQFITAVAIFTLASCVKSFSSPASCGRKIVKTSSTTFLNVQHVFIHDEGLSREDKDELMPCEVKRHGRVNKKVWREDAYNPDGPDLVNPRQSRGPPRPPTQPASAYVNVHDDEEPTMPGPPAHLFGNSQKVESFVEATVVPNEPVYQAPTPAPAPPTRAPPGPPPYGMFNKDTVDTSLLNLDFGGSSEPRTPPGPPPVGMFLKDTVDTSLLGEDESASWLPPSQPGPPPVGMFLTDETGGPNQSTEAEQTSSYNSPVGGGSSSPQPQQSSLSNLGLLQQLQKLRTGQLPDVRNILVLANVVFFAYQFLTTAYSLVGQRSTPIWPNAVTGNVAVSVQPLFRDWMFTAKLGNWQPHRYLMSGFVHSGILHLILNLDSIRRVPGKLERSVGSDVYGTTFLLALVAGHMGHAMWGEAVSATGVGAGITGLYGLFAANEFLRAKNDSGSQQRIAISVGKGLGRQLIYGLCLPRMFSNVANLSGFLAGIAGGVFFGLSNNDSPADRKRNVAGLAVWIASLSAILLLPQLRTAPLLVLRSLVQPGSLTAGRARIFYKGI